jgi:hypothetical protein
VPYLVHATSIFRLHAFSHYGYNREHPKHIRKFAPYSCPYVW